MSESEITSCQLAIVGGGASGYFTAANLLGDRVGKSCYLFEAGSRPLSKVSVSGGGRCNVTHHEFEVSRLVGHYPRGHREFMGPFSRFQPRDMMAWLENRGVHTKIEADGRVFPQSDDSGDIVNCLKQASARAGVETVLNARLSRVVVGTDDGPGFSLVFKNGEKWVSRFLVLATGSHPSGFSIAQNLGHKVIPTTPSLFTLNMDDARLQDLAGLSFKEVSVSFAKGKKKYAQAGPLLITHWGLSGPAILKLSAWASKDLAADDYQGSIRVDFAPNSSRQQVADAFETLRRTSGAKNIENISVEYFPRRYWQRLLEAHGLTGQKVAQIPKAKFEMLLDEVKMAAFGFSGKSTNKSEFVTAGGVNTSEVDLKTMQSKLIQGLYFTGEILNIDGVTGGFNFQHAWTSGFLCAKDLSLRLSNL